MPISTYDERELDPLRKLANEAAIKRVALADVTSREAGDTADPLTGIARSDMNEATVDSQLARMKSAGAGGLVSREVEQKQDPEVTKPDDSAKPAPAERSAIATDRATIPGEQEQKRGFDWARALYAFGGGNPTDIDTMRAAPAKQQMAAMELQDETDKRQQLLAMRNPDSPLSRQAQARYAKINAARSSLPGFEHLSGYFGSEAKRAAGMSAAEIAHAENGHQELLGESLKAIDAAARRKLAEESQDLRERSTAAQERLADNTIGKTQADLGIKKQELGIKREELGLKKAEVERKKKKDESIHLRATTPDAKTMGAINDAKEAIANIDRAIKLRSENDFYTGKGGKEIAKQQRELEGLPLVGKAVGMDQAKRDYMTTLGAISAPLTKSMIGTGQSKAELANIEKFIPSEDHSKEYSLTSLRQLRDKAVRTLGRGVADYHRKVGMPYNLPEDANLEAIMEAHNAAEQAHKQAFAEIGGASPDTGQTEAHGAGSDAAAASPRDAEALKWLQANPDDPGAPAVREVLKRKGLIK